MRIALAGSKSQPTPLDVQRINRNLARRSRSTELYRGIKIQHNACGAIACASLVQTVAVSQKEDPLVGAANVSL